MQRKTAKAKRFLKYRALLLSVEYRPERPSDTLPIERKRK
jgi:hypothetical protein